jgi:hypothetical protein
MCFIVTVLEFGVSDISLAILVSEFETSIPCFDLNLSPPDLDSGSILESVLLVTFPSFDMLGALRHFSVFHVCRQGGYTAVCLKF